MFYYGYGVCLMFTAVFVPNVAFEIVAQMFRLAFISLKHIFMQDVFEILKRN